MPTLSEEDNEDFLAFFKYNGKLVEDGYLDARRASDALQGIDEVLRFFIYQIEPELAKTDFELPIKVQKGSWEALIPHSLGDWIKTALEVGGVAYAKTALSALAKNDFKDARTIDVAKQAVKSIKWVLRIATHMKSMGIKKFDKVKFSESMNEGETLIGLENERADILYVPKEYLEFYKACPEKLFSKLMKNLAPERQFEIGFNPKEPIDKDDVQSNVTVDIHNRFIFTADEANDQMLFPELVDGQYVELNGHVTRGNEKGNTIGFEYLGHVITCSPVEGNIKHYKNLLFTNCVIKGEIDRSGKYNLGNDKRPHIKFESLIGTFRDDGEPLLL